MFYNTNLLDSERSEECIDFKLLFFFLLSIFQIFLDFYKSKNEKTVFVIAT